MSEFDFDELDRAVNHALTSDEPVNRGSDARSVHAAGATDSITVARTSMKNSTPSQVGSSSVPERSTTNPAVRRASSGRFMDMIHPSSDMRSNNETAPSVSAAPKPAPVPAVSTPSWASDHNVPTEPVSIPAPKTESQPPVEDLGFIDDEDEPRTLESPFLPDAKVEKRPLGGLASTGDMQFEDTPSSLSKSIDDALSEVALIEAEEVKTPVETPNWAANMAFRTDPDEKLLEAPEEERLLEQPEPQERIEEKASQQGFSDAMQYSQEKTLGDIPNPHADEPREVGAVPLEELPKAPESVSATNTSPAPVISSAVPAGPASITQQYTESPSSTAQPGAIFDTESYHQPITPKVKKRSGVWVVLWIILLIIAGAAAGAAFYLYVLPML